MGFGVLSHLERRSSDVRATRAEITSTINAVGAWRADHDRACPGSLADLVVRRLPLASCRATLGPPPPGELPGRRDPRGFDVSSDGADGEPRGLDRVE